MSFLSPVPTPSLDALRAEVRAIEMGRRSEGSGTLPFGIDAIDCRLSSGGLEISALHEAAGATPGLADEAAATLFLAAIAARLPGGTVLWTGECRNLFAPGLSQAGLSPDRLIFAECRRDEDVLAVMEEGLRHGGLAAVVGEVVNAAMASTRRLQLAAEEGKTAALMLKRWPRNGTDPLAPPSAAVTRWRIACAPSAPLPVPGVGRARWRLELARQRGGAPFEWIVEAPDAEARLALPAGSRDREVTQRRAA
jgi:protein ImuA